jgi:hypothetical protein
MGGWFGRAGQAWARVRVGRPGAAAARARPGRLGPGCSRRRLRVAAPRGRAGGLALRVRQQQRAEQRHVEVAWKPARRLLRGAGRDRGRVVCGRGCVGGEAPGWATGAGSNRDAACHLPSQAAAAADARPIPSPPPTPHPPPPKGPPTRVVGVNHVQRDAAPSCPHPTPPHPTPPHPTPPHPTPPHPTPPHPQSPPPGPSPAS